MEIVHLYDYEHQANIGLEEFIHDNVDNIHTLFDRQLDKRVNTNDGNVHLFMGGARYIQWCKGRTYLLSDMTLMYGGYPYKRGGKDERTN